MKTTVTKTYRETQSEGIKLAGKLNQGGVVSLYGNLGSGKTTFVQGLAKGLGIKQKIISPTFIIVRKYNVSIKNKVSSIKYFYHIDLYRIEDEKDIEGLGLKEILNDPENIVAIEWPEKIEKILPKDRTDIHFEYIGNNQRQITSSLQFDNFLKRSS
jgi:tRNA threonylcarbamoyladenosine biosynthesis protein TsaE